MTRTTTAVSQTVHRVVACGMFGLFVVSLVAWFTTRDVLPPEITIATGVEGGDYFDFGQRLSDILAASTGRRVNVEPTSGSRDNRDRLLSDASDQAVDLALVQGGSVPMAGLVVVAPVYPEVVHVIVRKGSEIRSVADLAGRGVVLGLPGSGMRQTALVILDHFGRLESEADVDGYYIDILREDASMEAAIVTTGMGSPDLRALLESGEFDLLPLETAKAISTRSAHLSEYEIPRGFYSMSPPIPQQPLTTVATTALLVTRADASRELVTLALGSLYNEGLQFEFPLMIPRSDILNWSPIPLHPAARAYLDPQDQIGWIANVMESIAAAKEILFALGAAIYLLWDRWRRLRERERQAVVKAEKAHLGALLEKTVKIEAAQMDTTDIDELGVFLDEVTRIKLRALQELTHEELRGDRVFAIFLMQCANLINKIQMKIVTHTSESRQSSAGDATKK